MGEHIRAVSGTLEVDGAPLYFEVAGTGPALALIHEGLADHRMFDAQVPAFAAHYRVVRYDLQGFGSSGTPEQPYLHHRTLRTLLDHLGITRTALLGMSMGAGIALEYALTYPEQTSALLLLAPGVAGTPPSPEMAALAAPMAEAFRAGDFSRGIDLAVCLWVDGAERGPEEVDAAVRERFRVLYTEVLRRSREGGRPADTLAPPVAQRLAEVGAPTLVMVGTGDVPDVQTLADRLVREIPDARLVRLPRAAHLLSMEQPEVINRLVLDFLAKVENRERGA